MLALKRNKYCAVSMCPFNLQYNSYTSMITLQAVNRGRPDRNGFVVAGGTNRLRTVLVGLVAGHKRLVQRHELSLQVLGVRV